VPRHLARPGAGHNDRESEAMMATADECRAALENLLSRIAELSARDRAAHVLDRTMSCRVTDLGVTFVTRVRPEGVGPVVLAEAGAPPAQVRFTAASDAVVAVGADPGTFLRAWVTGKIRVQGNPRDLLHLRRFL
jgi:hypothetical protein